MKGGGEKIFKFSLDTSLRGERKLCYNRGVIWEDCRLARAGRLSKGLVRASAEASQSGN